MKVPWCEYWEFLNTAVDIESADGLQLFEAYLRKRLRELIDRHAAELERRELLQNTSLCQLMQLLDLSDSTLQHSSQLPTSSSHENGILPNAQVQGAVCTTWPPLLAKLLPHSNIAAEVTENSASEESQKLPVQFPDEELLNGIHDSVSDNAGDTMSACSSDSFLTADNDSDFGFDLASDWPDEFDWQAVEPLFIYG